jgi:hypothetical protein
VNDEFYAQAIRRITGLTAAVGLLGSGIALIVRGPEVAGGFLVGAAVSLLNLEFWKLIARALGRSLTKPAPAAAAVFLGARYLIAGAVIYAIVRVSRITLGAVFAGLLVSLAAIILEILYEYTFLKRESN